MNGVFEFAKAALPWVAVAFFLAVYSVSADEKEKKSHE